MRGAMPENTAFSKPGMRLLQKAGAVPDLVASDRAARALSLIGARRVEMADARRVDD